MLFADPCGDYVSDVALRPDGTDAEFQTNTGGPSNPRADSGGSNQANTHRYANSTSCRNARVDAYP